MMKPEPSELMRRGARSASPCPPGPRRFLKNSSKNSSIGEPGGRSGMLPMRASTFCEVEILTTASITCSATSAIFSGPRAAAIEAGSTTIAAASAAAVAPKRARWQPFNNKPVRMKRGIRERGISDRDVSDRDVGEEDIGDQGSLQDHALRGCLRPLTNARPDERKAGRTQGRTNARPGEGAAAIR